MVLQDQTEEKFYLTSVWKLWWKLLNFSWVIQWMIWICNEHWLKKILRSCNSKSMNIKTRTKIELSILNKKFADQKFKKQKQLLENRVLENICNNYNKIKISWKKILILNYKPKKRFRKITWRNGTKSYFSWRCQERITTIISFCWKWVWQTKSTFWVKNWILRKSTWRIWS